MSLSQLKDYLRATSPLSKLQNSNKIPLKQIHNSIDAKLSLMREKPKNYQSPHNKLKRNKLLAMSTQERGSTEEYSEMKASSIIYNIPELSPPQINFEVSDQLRFRINEIKSEIVTKLPNIKSSQFSSNKLQSIFSRRIVLKDLQAWLQEKLKSPPLTHEDSIQYKNMIMGIGMKEVIRLIGTRCIQQANFVNQIWQLTWSICRQIILYLSKRAHKCEKILMEQTSFFRQGCELKIKTTQNELKETKQQNEQLKAKNQKLTTDITNYRKKNKQLKLTKFNVESSFNELKEQFQNIFKQNLLLHMRMSPNDHAKREFLKKKLRLFMDDKKKNKSIFKQFLDKFMKENNITIEEQQFDQRQLTLEINRYKSLQSKRNLQIEQQLYERFKNSDKQTQTPITKLEDKITQTVKVEKNEKMTETIVTTTEQFGMVTETIGQDTKKLKGKKDKPIKKTDQQKKKEKQKQKEKEKERTKLKLQQKTSIISSTAKQNTQISQQQKQAYSTEDRIELSYDKNRKKTHREQPSLGSKKAIEAKKNQFIQQEIEQQAKCQISYFAKQKVKQTKINSNLYTKQQKDYEEQKKMHEKQVDDVIKQKQNKIEQLKIQMAQKQIRYSTQLKQLKAQIQKSNSTPTFSHQTESPRLTNETLTEPFLLEFKQKQKEIDKQDLYLLQLIKNKDYQQLIQVLKDKRYIQQSLSLNNFSKRDSSSFEQQVLSSIQRQNPKMRGSKNGKKNGIESFLNSYGTNKCIDNQDLIQDLDAPVSYNKKKSKRTSRLSKNNILNDLKMIKTDLQQETQQSKPLVKIQPLSFAEACTNYLYHISPVQNNNSTKQGGLSDYTKKLLRDQYRELHRQVMEGNHLEKNEKQIRTVVEKGLNFVLKQLCKQFQLAQKQGLDRIEQIKISYSSLPIIMTNRFNLNFGVKKVASKHIKDFLVCLKGSKKFTQKYSIIAYFMLNCTSLTNNRYIFEYQEAQLLFFFILLINSMEGMTSDHVVSKNQAESISELCKKYLTRDEHFTEYVKQLPLMLQAENINNFVNFYKKLIKKYEQVSRQRLEQNQMIYEVLHRKFKDGKQGIKWIDFINFISVLNVRRDGQDKYVRLHSSIVNTIIQNILQQKNSQGNKLITHQCFMKFVVKCPEFSYKSMSIYIQSYAQLTDFDFSTEQSKQKILKLSQQNQLCCHIGKKISKKDYLTEPQAQFWLKYILAYSLQSQIDNILGNLLSGVLDPRTKQVVLGNSAQNQTVQSL